MWPIWAIIKELSVFQVEPETPDGFLKKKQHF
jgi:hypothetical protein